MKLVNSLLIVVDTHTDRLKKIIPLLFGRQAAGDGDAAFRSVLTAAEEYRVAAGARTTTIQSRDENRLNAGVDVLIMFCPFIQYAMCFLDARSSNGPLRSV